MAYSFDFSAILPYTPQIVTGIGYTLLLTAIGTVIGVSLGVLGAVLRAWRIKPFHTIFATYVELIRNTPFIIQLFFIFFGLPAAGIHLNEWLAAELAVIINLGAYSTEIIRSGIQAIPRGQIEAAASLAMTRSQIFRHIVLRPALQKVWPALSSQIVIVMLGTSVCSQISAEELTFAANFIQSRNFRAFETYIIVALIYLLMSIGLRALLKQLGKRLVIQRRHA
jgi:polar amino acid transport system permease protein